MSTPFPAGAFRLDWRTQFGYSKGSAPARAPVGRADGSAGWCGTTPEPIPTDTHPTRQPDDMSVTDELPGQQRAYADDVPGPAAAAARARTWPSWPAWTPASTSTASSAWTSGDAHVIRNAGGVVTDDEIRSLAISQRLLGTPEIILIHHTDCGMLTFTDDGFKASIQDETGLKPEWAAEAFDDVSDVRQSIRRIKASPFIPHKDQVRGFVFDVATGKLNEVTA